MVILVGRGPLTCMDRSLCKYVIMPCEPICPRPNQLALFTSCSTPASLYGVSDSIFLAI
jgi:hypothetical protein